MQLQKPCLFIFYMIYMKKNLHFYLNVDFVQELYVAFMYKSRYTD